MYAAKAFRILREIAKGAPQYRARPRRIPISMVVQRYRHLNQSLQKLLLRQGRRPPDVLERLMGLKEIGAVKQFYSCSTLIEIHATLWHTRQQVLPPRNTEFHS